MRWIAWIIQDPLAQMTFLSAVLTAAFVVLLLRKALTRGRSPALRYLVYTALAWVMFSAPCAYFWYQIYERNVPAGPLLHSKPAVTFHTTSGQDVTLESLRGRVVLLDFWASWCVPCRQSSPAIADMQKQYGAQLVTIGVDEDDAEADFRKGLTGARPAYDVFDAGQKLRWQFRVGPLPHFVVIDREGTVDTIETGWDPLSIVRIHEALERNLARH